MDSLLVINVAAEVSLRMTIVLCALTISQLKNLLKLVSKWTRNNEMQFGINKCSSLEVRREVSRFFNNSNLFFYLLSQKLPKMNCYTYFDVLFSNDI